MAGTPPEFIRHFYLLAIMRHIFMTRKHFFARQTGPATHAAPCLPSASLGLAVFARNVWKSRVLQFATGEGTIAASPFSTPNMQALQTHHNRQFLSILAFVRTTGYLHASRKSIDKIDDCYAKKNRGRLL
ncbi:MAG: hypothetical protein AABZ84_03150 [Pseudomonadota bacterium]